MRVQYKLIIIAVEVRVKTIMIGKPWSKVTIQPLQEGLLATEKPLELLVASQLILSNTELGFVPRESKLSSYDRIS